MRSEEQWKNIGACPDCDAPLYKMGNKFKWHDCPYDRMETLVTRINNLTRMVKDIDTTPVNRARRLIGGKTL